MRLIFITAALLITVQLLAQDYSIHSDHKKEFGSEVKEKGFFPESGEGIIPLQNISNGLSHKVFGYLPDWEYLTARNTLQYTRLTHLAAFDFEVSSTGNITNPSYWPWTDVINAAHTNGVKVILTAVNFNADQIRSIMTVAANKQRFFNQSLAIMQQYQLDGINIDFEGLHNADKGAVVVTFMQELTAFIKASMPNAEVSFAGPPVNWSSAWDLVGLANACDYVFIMGYAFAGSWSTTTGANAPLAGGSINLTNTVNVQYGGITNTNPSKLILGIPYYGHKWKTATNAAHSSITSFVSSTRFKNDVTDAVTHGRLWSSTFLTPWYRYQINSEWYQVWYDDQESIGNDYDFAKSRNLAGVGMWALGYDGTRPELWNLINDKFGVPVPVELIFFSAVAEKGVVTLKWITATETNNYGFNIEKQVEGEWIDLGFRAGKGTSVEPADYQFTDVNVFDGVYKYRLIQQDFDGKSVNAGETEVTVAGVNGYRLLQNYPNPFNPETIIKFSVPERSNVRLEVINLLGETVEILADRMKDAGIYEVKFDGKGLVSGTYFCRMISNGGLEIRKMILMK
jgi:spore germination protein YaaH